MYLTFHSRWDYFYRSENPCINYIHDETWHFVCFMPWRGK